MVGDVFAGKYAAVQPINREPIKSRLRFVGHAKQLRGRATLMVALMI